MEKLGSYELTGHMTSQNSGYSVWGFGTKNGKDYFIKQFLSPKYPENDTVSSPQRISKIIQKCERFEQKKRALYGKLNENSDGNAVRVEEFFRIESKYYISMRRIEAIPLEIETVAAFSEPEKRFLCCIIAHGIASLHKGHIVHADLKHDNILFMRCAAGGITAKIIDFDSGFLETDPPSDGEEIVGDQVYFSPEACKTFLGEAPELTCKMDVFALGILFHQYFTGELPEYDPEFGSSAGEAVARGGEILVSPELSPDIRSLLQQMLDPDPQLRPCAMSVYEHLAGKCPHSHQEAPNVPHSGSEAPGGAPGTADAPEIMISTLNVNPFFRPGDL